MYKRQCLSKAFSFRTWGESVDPRQWQADFQSEPFFRPFVFLLPGPFRHNLLPEASVPGTKAHPVSQLYRTAAAPHKAAQQLHIFFLCVTPVSYTHLSAAEEAVEAAAEEAVLVEEAEEPPQAVRAAAAAAAPATARKLRREIIIIKLSFYF